MNPGRYPEGHPGRFQEEKNEYSGRFPGTYPPFSNSREHNYVDATSAYNLEDEYLRAVAPEESGYVPDFNPHGPRFGPNYEPEASRYDPEGTRYGLEGTRYDPEGIRYAPEASRYGPDYLPHPQTEKSNSPGKKWFQM